MAISAEALALAATGWDDETDVAVVGGGGSGLRAALAAAESGARVHLYEKTAVAGGKTAMSIGIMTASQSSYQRRAGIEDTHAAHLSDIRAVVNAAGKQVADEDTLLFILQSSAQEVELLAERGVRFSGPHPEGAHKTPRMHVIQPDCRELVRILIAACEAAGVRIHVDSPARELVFDHAGHVAGVVVRTPDGDRRVRARAVVLTAGDYSGDTAFIAAVAPQAPLAQVFRDFASGDGHRMAMRAGAKTLNMASINTPHLRFRSWPFVEPSPRLFDAGAILIDSHGTAIVTRPGESAGLVDYDGTADLFVVVDTATAPRLAAAADDRGIGRNGWRLTGKPFIGTAPGVGFAYLEDCAQWEWFARFDSIAAAATHIGAPAERTREALAGKAPPFTVLGPLGCYLMNTGGGLAVDRRMNVLAAESDRPIEGLYSGGTNARIIPYIGHGYALAWAMASGRLAGSSAAAFAKATSRSERAAPLAAGAVRADVKDTLGVQVVYFLPIGLADVGVVHKRDRRSHRLIRIVDRPHDIVCAHRLDRTFEGRSCGRIAVEIAGAARRYGDVSLEDLAKRGSGKLHHPTGPVAAPQIIRQRLTHVSDNDAKVRKLSEHAGAVHPHDVNAHLGVVSPERARHGRWAEGRRRSRCAATPPLRRASPAVLNVSWFLSIRYGFLRHATGSTPSVRKLRKKRNRSAQAFARGSTV